MAVLLFAAVVAALPFAAAVVAALPFAAAVVAAFIFVAAVFVAVVVVESSVFSFSLNVRLITFLGSKY